MHPILIKDFFVNIHTYGVMVALGFLAGYFWMHYSARKVGDDPNQIADISLWVLISGVIGARLLFVLIKIDNFKDDPIAAFKIWEGGLVLYGGIIAAILVGIWLIKKKKMNLYRTADVAMPCVMLGLSIGRWGCLMVGCCFGKVCDSLPWAIHFHEVEGSMLPHKFFDLPLHPTQVYMSLNALLIFLVLTAVLKWRRFEGQVFYLCLILYSITRSIIECFRGDNVQRVYFGPLSTSQWISIGVGAIALWQYVSLHRKATKRGATNQKN